MIHIKIVLISNPIKVGMRYNAPKAWVKRPQNLEARLTIPNHITICSFVEGFPKYLVCCFIFQDIINAGPIFESSVHYLPRAGPYIGHSNNYSCPPSKSSKKSQKPYSCAATAFYPRDSEDNILH